MAVFKWAILFLLVAAVNGREYLPEDISSSEIADLDENSFDDDKNEIYVIKRFFTMTKLPSMAAWNPAYIWKEKKPFVGEKRFNGRARWERLMNNLAKDIPDRRSWWNEPGRLLFGMGKRRSSFAFA